MAATEAPKNTPGPKFVDPSWAIVCPIIEIERPKIATDTPTNASAMLRLGRNLQKSLVVSNVSVKVDPFIGIEYLREISLGSTISLEQGDFSFPLLI